MYLRHSWTTCMTAMMFNVAAIVTAGANEARIYYVAPNGDDTNPGTKYVKPMLLAEKVNSLDNRTIRQLTIGFLLLSACFHHTIRGRAALNMQTSNDTGSHTWNNWQHNQVNPSVGDVSKKPIKLMEKYVDRNERKTMIVSINPPYKPWFPKAPTLPPPEGKIIRVANVEELFETVEKISPGDTILIDDGHYMMPRYLEIHTDNVTLRGESGIRERVILDGLQSKHGELVGISRCSGVTIADLTIQNIKWNGFKINSDSNVQRVTIYNCIIHNIWQRGVKGVKVPQENLAEMRPKDCRIQYCLFYNDRPKRFADDPADTSENFKGNYIGGIDVMYAQNWVISDNVFIGIQGLTHGARGAIFIWHHSEDCVIERNIIIDCDTGIALGNSHRPPDVTLHCTGFIVRNNFITRTPESGIVADYTADCKIIHNTIHDPNNRLRRLIRLVHDNDNLLVANNLLSGPPLRIETASEMQIFGNVTQDLTDYFVNPQEGNLHLVLNRCTPDLKQNLNQDAPNITKAAKLVLSDGVHPLKTKKLLPEALKDISGQLRTNPTSIGADEL